MKPSKIALAPFALLGILAAIGALSAAVQDTFHITKVKVKAYCEDEEYSEHQYSSFSECEDALEKNENSGNLCGCRRVDGVFGIFSKASKWLL